MPESSKQFKKYAAQIDAEFAAEQKSKRVRIEDVDESDDDNVLDGMSCVGQNGDDVPNEDDNISLRRIMITIQKILTM